MRWMVAHGLVALIGAAPPQPHDCIDRCTAQTDGVHLERECYEDCMATAPDEPPPPEAAPHRGHGRPREIAEGFYLFGVPGVVNVPLLFSGYETSARVSWGWGLGGGYLWAPTQHFRAALGLGFEHWPMRLHSGFTGHHFRWMPELRLGGGGRDVWGYGLVAPGLVVSTVTVPEQLAPDVLVGFDLKVGAGVQGAVWRGLFLGGEATVDIAELPEPGPATYVGDPGPEAYRTAVLWLRLLIGWSF